MTTVTTHKNKDCSYSAFCFNLTKDFKRFCDAFTLFGDVQSLEARYEEYLSRWSQKQDVMNSARNSKVPFVNLYQDKELPVAKRRKVQEDPWMSNAKRIYCSVQEMYQLLDTNADVYSDPHLAAHPMSDDEITIFESSITSFLTTSTGQIDSLRQAIPESMQEHTKNHRLGIISHLLSELKKLMNRFQMLQHRRNREEMELFRDPLKCSPSNFEGDDLMDEIQCLGDLDDDYLARIEEEDEYFQRFYQEYENDELLEEIASAPLLLPSEKYGINQSYHVKNDNHSDPKPNVRFDPKFAPQTPEFHHQQQQHNAELELIHNKREHEILEQEQLFLSTSVQSTKLDGVQKAESQMMQVTALLSQFANLIAEQQEEVQVIAESTKDSRKNVDSGREKLVQATEQKRKGRHYFAWIIFTMGLALLFLNTIIA
jgi:hypothetical protein